MPEEEYHHSELHHNDCRIAQAQSGCWGCRFAGIQAIKDQMPCCNHMRGFQRYSNIDLSCTRRESDSKSSIANLWTNVPKPRLEPAERTDT